MSSDTSGPIETSFELVIDPRVYASYQRQIYASLLSPRFPTDPHRWEAIAQSKLSSQSYNYVAGNAGLGRTASANVAAFARYRLKPRMLVDATVRNTAIELFGKRLVSPLLVAPIGVQGIVHADGEEATARACEKIGMPMILSTAATRTIEQIATANGSGERWYQLYWPRTQDDDITLSLIARAKANGYTALVVTADTFSLGWRPADLDASYLPFIYGQGCQIGFSDPVFKRKYAQAEARRASRPLWDRIRETLALLWNLGSLRAILKVIWRAGTIRRARAWLAVMNSGAYRTWDDLAIIRRNWDGPLLVKGIQTVADAHRALDAGVDGIIVSNHGGRQVDNAIASLDALATITSDVRVRASDKPVLFDSGIRTGADVLIALALGAKAVLLGRPVMWGLAMGGQAGVEHVLKCILAEMDNTLGLIGKVNVNDLSVDDLAISSH